MRRVAKALIMSTVAAASAIVPLAGAQARGWHHHGHHYHNGVGLGVLGLATGAIIGGAIASDPGPRTYYEVDPPVGYYPPPPPRVVYTEGNLRPWTRGWYRFCESSYRTFDSRSGTYVGYDGREHFCVAN